MSDFNESNDKLQAFNTEANKWTEKLKFKKQLLLDAATSAEAKAKIQELLTGTLDSTATVLDKAISKKRMERQADWQKQYPNNPRCTCGCVMIIRKNSKTGDEFWGCTDFPNCTHTMKGAVQQFKRKRY